MVEYKEYELNPDIGMCCELWHWNEPRRLRFMQLQIRNGVTVMHEKFDNIFKDKFKDVPVGRSFILRKYPHLVLQRIPDFTDKHGYIYNASCECEEIIDHVDDDAICWLLHGL